MIVGKRAPWPSLLSRQRALTGVCCMAMLGGVLPAFAQSDAPEQAIAVELIADESSTEGSESSQDIQAEGQVEVIESEAGVIKGGSGADPQATISIALSATPGQVDQVSAHVAELLKKSGVSDQVIKEIVPKLEEYLEKQQQDSAGEIKLSNGNATLFASGVYIDSNGKQQKIDFQGGEPIAVEVETMNQQQLDQKLKAVEAAKQQLQQAVESLQFQQQAMHGIPVLEAPIPTIHALQMQQAPFTLGVQLQVTGDDQPKVIIGEVLPDSAAAEAGLKVGDVLIDVDQKPIEAPEQLRRAVQRAGKAGKSVKLRWQRDKEEFTAEIAPKKNEPVGMVWGLSSATPPTVLPPGVSGPVMPSVGAIMPGMAGMPAIQIQGMGDSNEEIKRELRELRQELRELKETLQSQQ